nr:hypothetical protein [Tanacetum cinerariifolium]
MSGSTIPTDLQHTPTIIQPSSSQPQKTQKPRKPTRKDTQVPQPSGPTEFVADEAVLKELGDRLVRAATTASSLEAEQDNSNITKTQSKETLNEPSSQGTDLGGGPRCQETIRDTTVQTRFESVSKHSNDSLLVRGNTLRSDEDNLKFNELMTLCTTLQNKVLDLEKTTTTQLNEINSLKRRVKKFENKNSVQDEVVSNDADKEMFDVDVLGGEEMFVVGKNENLVEEVIDAAQVSIAATTATITTEEITLAQALEALKTSKPKVKGIFFKSQNIEGYKLKDLKLKEFDYIQEMFDRAFKKVNTFKDFITELVKGKEKRAREELVQEITKKQKVEDDKEKAELN